MGFIPTILMAAGVGVSAYGQYRGGQEAKQVYEYNQELARYQSKYISDVADIEEKLLKREVSRAISRQRALAGASGTVPDTGSNLESLLRTEEEGEIEAAILRYKARSGIFSSEAQADLLGDQASNFNISSYLNAGSTLLTGAGLFDFKRKTPAPTKRPTPAPTFTTRQLLSPAPPKRI